MSPPAKFGQSSFTLGTRAGARGSERQSPSSLRVLVAGNFSGRVARDEGPIGGERARRIDIDKLDAVFSSLGARVSVAIPGGRSIELNPRSLDDLHPDQLLAKVPELAELIRLKNALPADPGAAARLTELLGSASLGGSDSGDAEPPSGVRESTLESGDDTLSRLLGGSPSRAEGAAQTPREQPPIGLDVQRLIKSLIGGLADAPAPPPDTTALASAAEHTIGERLRGILRSEPFRSLESAWRSIDGLIRQCPDAEQIHYFLLDVSAPRLAADLEGLAQILDGDYTTLLIDHAYAAEATELRALARLVQTCSARGVSVITGACAELAGCPGFDRASNPDHWQQDWSESVQNAWQELAKTREAGAELSLALPRFLLRQPYGSSGETLEAVRFEEILDPTDHEAFAWGNGAYLVAQALADLRSSGGDRAHMDGSVDVRELPVVHLESDEGIQIKPCAEVWLSDRALGRLLAGGFSVLHGLRDSDRVRVHF